MIYRVSKPGDTMTSMVIDNHLFSERERELTFAICHRPSVCLSSLCLSVVCNVRAPYSGD